MTWQGQPGRDLPAETADRYIAELSGYHPVLVQHFLIGVMLREAPPALAAHLDHMPLMPGFHAAPASVTICCQEGAELAPTLCAALARATGDHVMGGGIPVPGRPGVSVMCPCGCGRPALPPHDGGFWPGT